MAFTIVNTTRTTNNVNINSSYRSYIQTTINQLRALSSVSQIDAAMLARINTCVSYIKTHTHNYYDLYNSLSGSAGTRTTNSVSL